MGLFRFLWKTTSAITRTTFYLGGLYTFFAYFYVQEIKYRLGDCEHTYKKIRQIFKNQMKSLSHNSEGQMDPIAIDIGLVIGQIYTFYARAWHFRQYEQACLKFHRNVIKTVLKNYQMYGIFKHKDQMRKQIESNDINPVLMKKILQVKEVNQQFMMGSVDLYKQIIDKQVAMQTGSIIGLTESQKKDINLIYKYVQKGIFLMTSGNDKYWEYKLTQSEFKRHEFNDAIFQLAYI